MRQGPEALESNQAGRREKLKLGGKWLGPGRRKQACFASLLRLTGDWG